MITDVCPDCGGTLHRDGRILIGGRARWRCESCGAIAVDDNEPVSNKATVPLLEGASDE